MRSALIYTLFFLSGAAGLIYELVWVRELIFIFGGTTYAITTVLVAFMGGLGLGCYVAGRWCRRLHRPAQVYGLLEILIGAYARRASVQKAFLIAVAAGVGLTLTAIALRPFMK